MAKSKAVKLRPRTTWIPVHSDAWHVILHDQLAQVMRQQQFTMKEIEMVQRGWARAVEQLPQPSDLRQDVSTEAIDTLKEMAHAADLISRHADQLRKMAEEMIALRGIIADELSISVMLDLPK